MASASLTTAPSTQPPLTLPATSPSSFTAIAAPGRRGPEPSTSTTRARATRLPCRCHRCRSRTISFTTPPPGARPCSRRDYLGELGEGGDRVPLQELVNVWEGRCHSGGERR